MVSRILGILLTFTFVGTGCDTPKQESPPVYPGDEERIRERVQRPTGRLGGVTTDEAVAALTDAWASDDSPTALVETLFDVVETSTMETKSRANPVDAPTQFGRVQHGLQANGSVNGWVEMTVLCGPDPMNHREEDGRIDLTYLVDGDLETGLNPLDVAWGTARNCALWDQETPLRIDGDIAILFSSAGAPHFFEFIGTLITDTERSLDVAGYYLEDEVVEVAWTTELGNDTFVVGIGADVLFVHDCSGRWRCEQSPLTCAFQGSGSTMLVIPSCERPTVELLTW